MPKRRLFLWLLTWFCAYVCLSHVVSPVSSLCQKERPLIGSSCSVHGETFTPRPLGLNASEPSDLSMLDLIAGLLAREDSPRFRLIAEERSSSRSARLLLPPAPPPRLPSSSSFSSSLSLLWPNKEASGLFAATIGFTSDRCLAASCHPCVCGRSWELPFRKKLFFPALLGDFVGCDARREADARGDVARGDAARGDDARRGAARGDVALEWGRATRGLRVPSFRLTRRGETPEAPLP